MVSYKVGDIVVDLCGTKFGDGVVFEIYNNNNVGVRFFSTKYYSDTDHHIRYFPQIKPSPIMDTPLFKALQEN